MNKFLISILFSLNTFAISGVIKVLEAPILYKKNESSTTLMSVRKGSVIFINDNSIDNDVYYKTITKDGMDGYVLKSYVKLIHNDLDELDENITMNSDPTDYIIDEPLPENYPFTHSRAKKALMNINYGQGISSSYGYNRPREREQINNSASMEMKFLRRPKFDLQNRFYYGFHIGAKTGRNEFQFTDRNFSTETHASFSAGPVINYTFYRRETFEIDSSFQLGFNYHRTFVQMQDIVNDEEEERTFTGLSISGSLSTLFIHRGFAGNRYIDFIHGPAINFNLPYTLSASAPADIPASWSQENFSVSSEVTFAYVAGIMYRY